MENSKLEDDVVVNSSEDDSMQLPNDTATVLPELDSNEPVVEDTFDPVGDGTGEDVLIEQDDDVMRCFVGFKLYKPRKAALKEIAESIGALFLKCNEGNDWYEAQKQFKKDTIKVMYDSNNVVVGYSKDASTLFPLDLSVAEVAAIPTKLSDAAMQYQYVDGKVVPRVYTEEELAVIRERSNKVKLSALALKIAPLQDAVDLGIATDEEKEELAKLKLERVTISRSK